VKSYEIDPSEPPENKAGVNFYGRVLDTPDTYDIDLWRRLDDRALVKAYFELFKACFGSNMFYRNARRAFGLLARILIHERGITEVEVLGLPIEILEDWE
jgi:hypothetical protein